MLSKLDAYKPLLRQRDFLATLAGNTVSRFGDSIDSIAFAWIVYQVTGSASLMALILAVNYLPTILLQPFAGVLSEQMDKRRTVMVCDAVRGGLILLIAALYRMGLLSVPMLFAVTLLQSGVEALEMPAGSALTVRLLPQKLYTVGASLRGAVSRAAELVGLACAGGIVAVLGAPAALLIDAATFFICCGCYGLVRYREEKSGGAQGKSGVQGYFSMLREGVAYAVHSPLILALMLLGMMINLFLNPINSFSTIYIIDDLRFGETMGAGVLSAANVCLTIGLGLGAFVYPFLEKSVARRKLLMGSGMGLALTLLILSVLPPLPEMWMRAALLFLATFLCGICAGIITTVFSASFMEAVGQQYMARVSGLMNAGLSCAPCLGSLCCSGLAALLPVPAIFALFGGAAAVFFLLTRRMRGFRSL